MVAKPTYEELARKVEKLEREATLRIEAIVSLEETVERYRTLFDTANDLIHSVTPDGDFIYVNQAWLDALGYSASEVKSMKLMDIVDESCRKRCRSIFNCLIEGRKLDRNETVFVAKNGRRITVEGRCSTKFKNGRPVAMTGIFRDITERAANEQALRDSEKRYRDLFENANDLIQIVNPDGGLLYVNRAWRQTFGYGEEEVADLNIFDLISPACQEHCYSTFNKVLSREDVHYIETVFLAKDGREIIIEGNAICKFKDGIPLYSQCILRDVTEKKKLEQELLKAQKLESVGVFAGGIAHDFNNLLTAILGNISLAKMYINPHDKISSRLEKAEKASLQARSLTQQLLTFSKGGAPIKKTSSITELIKDSASFTLRGSNVRIVYQFAADLWPTEIDEGQICQVIQNLVINACEAMPDGGVITVAGRNKVIGHNDLLMLPAGKYLQLTFSDQGTGIARENVAKIFDPYFTNKRSGSGLGLAIAYSIINKHEGLITVESRSGKGSTFFIYLPASPESELVREKSEEPAARNKGKILIMDDEEIVRDVAVEMLAMLGCTTETAADGQEAIELYSKAREAGDPFDLVIMDLTIPGGMGGKETIEKLLAIDPDVRAVVSSGYANDPIMARYFDYGFCGVVPKPYKINELSRMISELHRRQADN